MIHDTEVRHGPMRRSRRGDEDDRGAVLPLAALAMVALLTMSAFAVDLGRLRAERRDLQAIADAIALDSVQVLDDQARDEALADALTEANASADRNDWQDAITVNELEVGNWVCSNATDPCSGDLQFVPASGPSTVPDAVRVTLASTIPMHFDLRTSNRSVSRSAVAVEVDRANAELGSVFAGIQTYQQPGVTAAVNAQLEQQATFMNNIFTEYFGVSVAGGVDLGADVNGSGGVTGPATGLRLDALSYRGLALGDVSVDQLAAAMGFGDVDSMATSNVAAGTLLNAAATVLTNSPDAADVSAGSILGTIAANVDNTLAVDLGQVFGLSSGDNSAADSTINALGLLGASGQAINGNEFLAAEMPINVPSSIPLFDGSSITPRISVIQGPQTDLPTARASGQSGPENAQVKVAFEVPLQEVTILGVTISGGSIPIVIEAAKATSTYTQIRCAKDIDQTTVDFSVSSNAVAVSVGTTTDAELQQAGDVTLQSQAILTGSVGVSVPPLPPVGVDLGSVTSVTIRETYQGGVAHTGGIDANAGLLGAHEDTKSFTGPFPTDFQRYHGGTAGTNAFDSTYGRISYDFSGIDVLVAGTIEAALDDLLQPVVAELDAAIIEPLLESLGVTVAGADARILRVQCQIPALTDAG